MDEIEYLEEYEDLILPAMSSHSAATKGRATSNVVSMADDEDSSSIDQDIFESLFDDHSDDESIAQRKVPSKLGQRSERSSQVSRMSMDSLDLLAKDLGEPLNAIGSKAANKPIPKSSNTKNTQPSKVIQKASTTSANIKGPSTPMPATSDNNKTSNKSEAAERNSKLKSVATVRPTVQQSLAPTLPKQTNENSNDNTTNRAPPVSTAGGIQNAKVTTVTQNSSKRTPTPTIASTSRKQTTSATSTTGSSSSAMGSSKSNAPIAVPPPKRIIERSQTTIIKPEKPQIKDPAEDPLSLENIENESDSDTDSFVYSDISADTFVSLSDVDDEERQVIELSNDSNSDRANLELYKKGPKGRNVNQTPTSTTLTTMTQKVARESLNSTISRSAAATPTAVATRKRARDLTPNTTAEVNDKEKSPGKKLKLDSLRKSTRIHNDDIDASEGELDAAVAQRHSRLPGGKEAPANRNTQERSIKSVGTTENSVSKSTQPSKQSVAVEIKEAPGTRTKDKPTSAASNTHKAAAVDLKRKQDQKTAAKPAGPTTAAATSRRSEAKVEGAKAMPASDALDPLEIPVKRIRRLQAIDGHEAVNLAEELKAEELDKKNSAAKRKSLRAGGQTDTAKDAETNKAQTKQQQQPQQQQQQQKVSRSGDNTSKQAVKGDGKDAGKSSASVDKGNTSTSKSNAVSKSQASPTKSPGSKVITFMEWLEQQSKGSSEGVQSADVEGSASTATTAAEADVALASSSDANLMTRTLKSAADTAKPSEVIVSAEKDVKQAASVREVRDASRKRKDAVPSTSKETRGALETAKEIPTTSRRDASEKASPTRDTNTPIQFKRPSLPQRSARATPVARGSNRTPTPVDNRRNLNSTPQSGRHSTLQKVDNKWKLRKLRVRVNRCTVVAYFKKLTLDRAKKQVKHAVDEKIISTSLEVIAPRSEAAQKLGRQNNAPTISQKRVALKAPAPTLAQLPTLTARPTAAAVGNVDQTKFTGALPKLTKVPNDLEKGTLESQNEAQVFPTADAGYQQDGSEELSLLTPMKSIAVTPTNTTSNSRVQQQKQQSGTTATEAMREKRGSASSSTDSCSTQRSLPTGIAKDTQASFTPVVPKEELVDDQQQQSQQSIHSRPVADASADNSASTNSLASRTLAIAAATNSALNQTPSSDPSGYYGLTPTQLDSNGTRLYSFLHPAKYNRNHGCVLLDYCCPNLDGPMPAIDPTRIHAQVQAGVRELPAYIVMTTKLITRADLEANKNVIPASIRQKVEKITADASNASANQSALAVVSGAHNASMSIPLTPQLTPASKPSLTPTITALQKHLPATTIITPKLLPAASTSALALPINSSLGGTPVTTSAMQMSDYQRSLLRTSVRQFDARLKKYYYRVAMLSFSDRQTIIDNIINSTSLTPKDVECAVRLLDEYASQISLLPISSALGTPKPTTPQAMQSISKATTTPTTSTVARTTTIQQQIQKQHQNQQNSMSQLAVLDKDNSLLGYQMTSSANTLSKSTVSTRSSILSTTTKNTSLSHVKAAQDSPRIFYTKPPMQTSTPIATTTSNSTTTLSGVKTVSLRSTPRLGREVTIRQLPTKIGSVSSRTPTATATPPSTRRLPTLTRNPHLTTSNTTPTSTSAVNTTPTSETITTRSAVTISTAPKRMTRASAAAKVIVITQNNEGRNTPLDECILPDGNNSTEIKRERLDDDFVGGN